MAHVTLVLGGCRSGKSAFALKTANEAKAGRRIFIATAVALDDEMRARVKQHRAERGAGWMTVEAPLALAEAVAEHGREGRVILVDCLTLWISNLLLDVQDPAQAEERIPELVSAREGRALPGDTGFKRSRLGDCPRKPAGPSVPRPGGCGQPGRGGLCSHRRLDGCGDTRDHQATAEGA